MFYQDQSQLYRCTLLDSLDWLEHGFGTRHSGVWVSGPLATLRQVHSDRVLYADGHAGIIGEGDALFSDQPGLMLGVWTADCVPLLLADPARKAVAAVHCGWRGAVRSLVLRVTGEMERRLGSRPADLIAAIGPSICGACYRVGPEVARQFQSLFPERADLDGATTINLAEACQRQLLAAGLQRDNIAMSGLCTYCRPQEFFSYRRGHQGAARMLSAIGLRSKNTKGAGS